jgi:glucose-6-phosphate 1-dehydrogenase
MTAQRWSGIPLRLRADDRSALEREADQRWSGVPLRLRADDRAGLERTTAQA